VRKAEELVREGKIDLAIEEFLRLVEDPADVGAANALGDLYAKTGNRVAAVQQFVRIGDHHRDSGFVPKAVAFYKKALKADPACDHALSQLASIAVEQELFADATLYLNRLLQRRRDQNNEAGVADCLVRLGGFPSASPEARLAAARASANHYGAEQTARLWVQAADALEGAGREREAVDPLMEASTLDPDDLALRRRVALACATTGQIDRVRAFLSFETAADHPDLLLALAEYALADARDDDARVALQRVVAVAPERRTEAEAMLAPLMAASAPEATASEPEQPAVSESEPSSDPAHADFFAVSIEASTDDEPLDVAAAFGVGSESESAVDELVLLDAAAAENALEAEPEPESEPEPQPQPQPEPEPDPKTSSDRALEDEFVAEAAPEPIVEIAREPAPSASQADLDSITALTAAAQNPALQFQASAQLGRLLLRLGRIGDGIEWLEKASRAATPVREQRLDLMYELADALERAGERARALDVFADLDFDAASYRDVPERMAALRRGLAEGSVT
jgi:tetratricopeptide (TPR) repeat protein